jgi:hypothetical protein
LSSFQRRAFSVFQMRILGHTSFFERRGQLPGAHAAARALSLPRSAYARTDKQGQGTTWTGGQGAGGRAEQTLTRAVCRPDYHRDPGASTSSTMTKVVAKERTLGRDHGRAPGLALQDPTYVVNNHWVPGPRPRIKMRPSPLLPRPSPLLPRPHHHHSSRSNPSSPFPLPLPNSRLSPNHYFLSTLFLFNSQRPGTNKQTYLDLLGPSSTRPFAPRQTPHLIPRSWSPTSPKTPNIVIVCPGDTPHINSPCLRKIFPALTSPHLTH